MVRDDSFPDPRTRHTLLSRIIPARMGHTRRVAQPTLVAALVATPDLLARVGTCVGSRALVGGIQG